MPKLNFDQLQRGSFLQMHKEDQSDAFLDDDSCLDRSHHDTDTIIEGSARISANGIEAAEEVVVIPEHEPKQKTKSARGSSNIAYLKRV